jgi:cation diffusion facilitator family transporter
MFAVDLIGGILGESSGLIADSLDMLADASAYALALAAIGRSAAFKVKAAGFSGILLLALGLGVVLDVIRRAIFGSEPVGLVMLGVALLALAVNTTVLRLLSKHRDGGVHIRAAWIFTRADVLANLGVILGGVLVSLTDSAFPDLVVGFAIGLYVMKEAMEILREARLEQRRQGSTV